MYHNTFLTQYREMRDISNASCSTKCTRTCCLTVLILTVQYETL